MSYDEGLLERVRRLLAGRADVVEKRMVGGRSFSLLGRMCCRVSKDGVVVRLGRDGVASALDEPHVSRMSLGGRSLAAFVIVAPEHVASDAALDAWVQRGLAVVAVEANPVVGLAAARPRRRAKLPSAALGSAAERFAELAEHFAHISGVTLPDESVGRSFGSSAAKVNGSIFAMLTRDRLVVKLPRTRVTELVEAGTGSPVTAGKNAPMRGWVTITDDDQSTWLALAREALEFAANPACRHWGSVGRGG